MAKKNKPNKRVQKILASALATGALLIPAAAYAERSGGIDVASPITGTYENGSDAQGGALYQTIDTTINAATFSANQSTGTSGTDGGGAIYVNNKEATVNIAGSEFTGNKASYIGGAMYLYSGTANIDNTTFKDNTAEYGGAVYTKARVSGALNTSDLVITDSVFEGNQAKGAGALGLMRNATLSGVTFENNTATEDSDGAGALFVGAESNVVIHDSVFEGNKALEAGRGGAISTRDSVQGNNSAAKLDISNTVFQNNTAATTGGAIDNHFYHSNTEGHENEVYISASDFTSNSADKGGAIYNHKGTTQTGSMYIGNGSVFEDNTATTAGGAIYNEGTITLGNVEFSGNKAGDVANDIYNTGTLNINGSVDFDGGVTGAGLVNLGASSVINMLDEEVTGSSVLTASTLDVADGAQLSLDWGDSINASSITGSALKIADLYVDGTKLVDGGKIDLFTGDAAGTIDTSSIGIFSSDGKYTVALGTGEDAKKLVLAQNAGGGLAAAVEDGGQETLYSFKGTVTEDMSSASDEGVDVGNLNIIGDASTENKITLNNKGIGVAGGHHLNVENTNLVSGTGVDEALNIKSGASADFENSSVDKAANAGDFYMDFTKDATITTKLTGDGSVSVETETGATLNWNPTEQAVQSSFTFKGDGHTVLGGDAGFKGDFVNKMTGDTLVISTLVDGDIDSTSDIDNHIELATGADVTGLITNSGTLDITASSYTIKAGIADLTTPTGTTNIGDATHNANVSLAANETITQANLNIAAGSKLTSNAANLATTNAVDNQGKLVLTGSGEAGVLGANITDSQSTKTGALEIGTTAGGTFVSTNGHSITQSAVTIANGASETSKNKLYISAGDTITAPVTVGDYDSLILASGTTGGAINGDVTLNTANSDVELQLGSKISGNIISDNNATISLIGLSGNAKLSEMVTGDIKGSSGDGQYKIIANGIFDATIDKAIKGATGIEAQRNTNITDVAYTSTNADIVATSNATLTLDNTTADSKTVGSKISAKTAGNTYDLNIVNSNATAGTTVIGAAVTGADDVNVKSGTTQFNADVTSAKLTVDNGATLQSDASHLKTTNAVDNQGKLVLTGDYSTTGKLGADITDSQSTKTGVLEIGTAAGSSVTTNGHDITQSAITVATSTSSASNFFAITAGDTVTAPITVGDGAAVDNYGDIIGDVTLSAAASDLYINDAATVTGNVAGNGGAIGVYADTSDALLSQISGDLTGTYRVIAESSGTNTVTVDKAISGATKVTVTSGSNAKITDTAYTSTTAPITVGDSATLTLDNTTSASKTVGNAISASSGTYDLNIVNSNATTAGTTVIGAAVTGADNVNIKSGTATFDANVTSNNLTVDSGTTLNVNSGKTASGNLANSGTVDNSGTLSGTIDNKTATSKLTTATGGLTNSADIKNDGTITFNDTAATGTIAQNIEKSTTAGGIVEIAGGANTVISLAAGKTITDNALKLTSGTFDATNMADSSYNIDLSSLGTGLIGNGGTLSTQDGHAGTITLGDVDLSAGNVNLAIDLDLVGDGNKGAADNFTRTGTITSGAGKLNFSNIVLTADAGSLTEDNIKIADNTINTSDLSLGQTTISGTNIGNLLLTFTSDSEGTYLHTAHSDLTNAIKSTIVTKAYNMTADESIDNPLTLGGTSLSITGNGKTISGNDPTAKGVTIGTSAQTLTINNATVTGFTTAIDNAIGGTVNLNGVTMTGNTTADVNNAGTGNLNLDGTNSINIITGDGTTNVNTGTTTIGTSLTQGTVNVGNASTPSDAALINNGTVNATDMNVNTAGSTYTNNTGKTTTLTGKLTNKGTVANNGTLSADTLDNQKTISGTGKMTLANGGSNSGTGASITQNDITLNGGTFNNSADMTANGLLTNKGTLNNTSNVQANTLDNDSVISGAGNLKVVAGGTSDGVISQATVELTGGTFDNNSNITTTGTFKNGAALDNTATITSGGAFTNTGVITTDTAGKGTIIAQAGGSSNAAITQAVLDFAGGSFDNDANMTATTSFTVESGASLDNSAKILAQTFANAGTVSDASGNGVLEVTAGGSASGNTTQKDITLQGGTFDNTGTMTSTGTFTNHATVTGDNGTLNVVDGSSDGVITQGTIAITGAFDNDANMTAKTLLDIDTNAVVTNDAVITAAKFENDGTINQATTAGGTLKIAGTSYNAGTITQTLTEVTGGTFTNETTGEIYGTTFQNDSGATTTNKGKVGSSTNPVTTVQNDGTFTNDTAGTVYAGTLDNNNSMTNKNSIVATTVENDGTYANSGTASSLIATTINNNTGTFTNDGSVGSTTTPVTTLNNKASFTNNGTGTVLATTIDNQAGADFTNDGNVGTTANPVGTITNNGASFKNTNSVVADAITTNTSMENTTTGTIVANNSMANAGTFTNDGKTDAKGTFTNTATVANSAEGQGELNVKDGSNSGTITQGDMTIAAGNTGFTNTNTINTEKTLTNNGTFNDNNGTINANNSTNNSLFDNKGTFNGSNSNVNADNVKNTNGTMNLTKSKVIVGYQADDIAGTINIKGTSETDKTDVEIKGTNPSIVGAVNVGGSGGAADKATMNLKAGNVVEDAILAVSQGSVLNVDNSADTTAPASVVVNGSGASADAYNGDITMASGAVTLKDITVDAGKTSTTTGGTKPYYAQTGGDLTLTNSTLSMEDASLLSGGNMNVDSKSTYIAQENAFTLDDLQNSGLVQVINGQYNNFGMDNLIVGSSPADQQGDFTADLYARSNTNKNYDSYGDSSTVISAGDTTNHAGTVNVSDWQLNGDLMGYDAPIDREIYFDNFFQGSINPGDTINFTATDKRVFTPIGNYQLQHAGGGAFKLSLVDYNPQVFRGQVTKLAQYENQLAIDDMLFTHSMVLPSFKDEDGGMSKSMLANRYAGAGDLYAPYQYSRKDGGVWYKAYGNFEKLNMNHGLHVGNNGYGALVGADFGLKQLRNGWKFMPTAYIGYNGAHQYFNRVSAYQNGGQAGLMGTWYKENFLIGALAYGGVYNNHMTVHNYSSEDSFGYFAGASVKTAYNWRLGKDFVIQPNLLAAYNYFGKENWHTDFGQMGMMSGMLHGVNIAPGVNFILEKKSWSAYLTVQYMYNVNQSIGGRAGNVSLPRVSMDRGYIQYGIGATKRFKDRFQGYIQAVIRNAGRTGIGLQAGFEISLGKDPKKTK